MSSRREFLGEAGGVVAGTVAAGVLPSASARAGASSSRDAVRCGLVGVGGRGSGLLNRLAGHPQAVATAVCDVDARNRRRAAKAAADKQKKAPKQADDFRRLLDDDSVDALFIATPHHWHAPIALRALEAGKHVYVEKPASHVFEEGRLLIDAAERHGRVLQHGTQMRSSEVTAAAGKVLADGMLGEIQMARGWSVEPRNHPEPVPDRKPPDPLDWNMWLGPAPKRAYNPLRHKRWRWFRDYGNGEIGDDGVHDLDMSRWGLGATDHPVRITATGARIDVEGKTEYPTHLTVSYQYADGRELLYEFYGTEGYMIFSRRGYFQTYLGAEEKKGPGMEGGTGTGRHVDNFLEAIRNGEKTNAGPEVAHLSAGLVHLGEIAYRTGRALRFDAEKETFPDDAEAAEMLSKAYRDPWAPPGLSDG